MSHHESKRPEPSVIAARPVHSSPFVKWYRHQGRSPRRGTQYVPGMSARPRVDSLHAYDTPPQGRAGQAATLTPETRNPTFPSDEARLPSPSLSPPINLMSRLSLQSTLSLAATRPHSVSSPRLYPHDRAAPRWPRSLYHQFAPPPPRPTRYSPRNATAENERRTNTPG